MLAKKTRRILSLALVLIMVISMFPMMASAAPVSDPLQPSSKLYEKNEITLSKTAVRTAEDEWDVTVTADIGNISIKQQALEVVFVLDRSGSMAWCTAEAHKHDEEKCKTCDEVAHSHTEACENCPELVHTHVAECWSCKSAEHTHSEACCTLTHTHDASCCSNTFFLHDHNNTNRCDYSQCKKVHTHSEDACIFCDTTEHTHLDTCEISCGNTHTEHSDACTKVLTCGFENEHVHGVDCDACTTPEHTHNTSGGSACWNIPAGEGQRFAAAKTAISNMVAKLPANTIASYVVFNGSAQVSNSSFSGISPTGSTDIMSGVDLGIKQFTSSSATKKILVLVSDGEDNNDKYTSEALKKFTGSVYTVGFTIDNQNLKNMVKNGGVYMTAGNTSALEGALQEISSKISAMVVDPMGPWVDYVDETVKEVTGSVKGVFVTSNREIKWLPLSADPIKDKVISFTYKVKLNSSAPRTAGTYFNDNTFLNGTTYLQYGEYKDKEIINGKTANFPIPQATYSVATLETSWVKDTDSTDLQTPTSVSKISDWFLEGTSGDKGAVFDIVIPGTFEGGWNYRDSVYDGGTAEKMTAGTKVISDNKAHTLVNTYTEEVPVPTGTLTITKALGTGSEQVTIPADTLFKVYEFANGNTVGGPIAEFKYSDMTAGSKVITGVEIDKSYVVRESGGEIAGYKLEVLTGSLVALDAEHLTGTLTVTNNYTKNGYNDIEKDQTFTITKLDGETQDELNGVVFGLFSSKACEGEPLKTFTTVDGKIVLSAKALGEGTFYLKETQPKDGYELLDTVWKLDVTDSGWSQEVVNSEGFWERVRNWFISVFRPGNPDAQESEWIKQESGLVVFNYEIPEQYGELTITKDVAGAFNEDTDNAFATFTVTGPEFNETFTLNKANGWSKTFPEILVGDYTVTETGAFSQANYSLVTTYSVDDADAVNGSAASVTVAPYESFDSGADVRGNFVDFINTYTYNPPGTLLYTLTVNHIGVDEDGNRSTLRPSSTTYHGFGEAYRLEAGEFTDWTFLEMDEGSDAATGTMNGNKVVTFIYAPDTDITPPSDPLAPGPSDDDLVEIPDPSDPLADTPQTSDGNNMFLLIAIMLSCALGLVAINLPRRKKNEK